MSTVGAETTTRDAISGRLSGVVYDRIVDMIASGAFPLNSRLPTEMELSERFDASRPVVREALQRLRDDGLIVSRQGSGSYVKRRPEADVLQLVPVGSLADVQRCFEFRAGLEPATAALAAQRRDDPDLDRLAAAMQALENCLAEGHLGVEEDSNLHDEIARATHNQYHVSVQASLRSHVIAGMNVTRSLSLRRSQAQLRAVQDEHEKIVEAIRSQDADAAYAAMKAHILNARNRMFEGI
ncbi:FadR/GntR family transcriptional regulator [Devosia nitrariae]|uniref:GntR family transcriptional regulator n=1 Tax=Devosia nitrariae TaxID=2071872 RepID=A0ABQ5W4L1_9HYPH|nr:FadR/GntR family transcriptional regulator [Devosia nitrariae]GLQ54734.1 GntR family transcriptional regulator [Devosia nitrariae]